MSYTFCSQQGEDVYVFSNFINKINHDGVFVEIGGYNGLNYSNTKFFEDHLGFRGVLIEPTQKFHEMKINRPNCDCYNLAVAKTKSVMKFIGDDATAGLACTMNETFKSHWHKNSFEYDVETERFSDILARSNVKYIDFMSIDVEGGEEVVLETFDFSVPVYVIVIELDGGNLEKDENCRNMLRKNGFEFNRKIQINEYWINHSYFRKKQLYESSIPKPKINSLFQLGKFPYIASHLVKDLETALSSENTIQELKHS